MARIIDDKLIFIHIAKCGGTYIKEILSANGIKNKETGEEIVHDHISYNDLIKDNKNLLSYKFIATIRQPHNWIISRHSWALRTEFNYKIKCQPTAQAHWMAKCWDDDLIKFTEKILINFPSIPTDYYQKMTNLLDIDCNTNIFTIENVELLFSHIENETNNSIKIKSIENIKKTDKKLLPNEMIKELIKNNQHIYNKYYGY